MRISISHHRLLLIVVLNPQYFKVANYFTGLNYSGSRMKAQCLPLDIISNLPSSIIQTILTFLPIRDAFRTSILSRKWRYHCANIPKLEFNEGLWRGPEFPNKHKLFLDIYTILLLHHCPVLEFSLCIPQLKSCCEIDQIIHYLSRNTALEKFTLCIGLGIRHKLPTSFFSLQNLTHLKLRYCAIPPLATFPRFGRLTSLCFYGVVITDATLLQFLSCCPMIKNFTLIEYVFRFTSSGCSSDFVDLFCFSPYIERLEMNRYPVKFFSLGVKAPKSTKAIVHLKYLGLSELSFANEDELSSVYLLVSNSPNIKKIKLEMCRYNPNEVVSQTAKDFFDVLDYSDISLEHLHELEITNFGGIKPEMDFLKLILANSPMLDRVQLVFCDLILLPARYGTLEALLGLPRASSRAKIILKP
ncbi:hypothetical protein M8C21_011417 [Ambrosia artemisiifolia]|uniref:F-box domain-containing protein n=1 Tax=Ambrosia artemisiifolia TaxID=4212 RepID=A0AAD5GG39_AMBAR|nr:hypothetical protein M8C21_011417 [Ambrosia artemisiifolia]